MKIIIDLNSTNDSDKIDYITTVDTNVAILQTVVCMVTLPIGIILVYGIVLYEHEGVDSQKRSIFNQLISSVFITLSLTGLTATIPMTIRCWTGPFGHILGIIVSLIRRFFFTFFLNSGSGTYSVSLIDFSGT